MATESANEPRKAVPYYEQVANVLRANVVSDEQEQVVRLPPERDLCEIHGVSRITIRKALELLEQEGLVQRTPGRGTLTVPAAIKQWKRLRKSRVIHLLSDWQAPPDNPASFYGQICQGIFEHVEQAGYRLSMEKRIGHRTDAVMQLHLPDPHTTLGIITVGVMNETTIRAYTDAGYAVVCLDYWTTNPLADAIVIDCYGEGQAAVEFLVRHGHNRLFYVGNSLTHGSAVEKESDAELLLAGMQRALGLMGRPTMSAEQILFTGSDPVYTEQVVDWLLAQSPRPTAGVLFSCALCRNVIEQLQARGVRCPEDISLITKAWDGEPIDLACLRGDARTMGELAVDALLDRAKGRRTVPVRLAVSSRLERGRTVRQISGGSL